MRICLFFCLLLITPLAVADSLQMANSTETKFSTPTRGMNMAAVEAQWGMPIETHPPVGEPPITRWVYDDFIVYFEYDKVIHSVTIN